MTISSDLKYAISMWKQYKLRERIAISLTFENPKLLSYVQLNKEMREHMDKDEDFPPELESKIKAQDSEYLDNCRTNIYQLLEIINVTEETEIQVITSDDNTAAIGEINDIKNSILKDVLEDSEYYDKENFSISKCSYANLQLIIDGIIGADYPNTYDSDLEYEEKTISSQTLFYFPSSGFIFYLYDGRGGIISSLEDDSKLFSDLLVDITTKAPHILNQYWFQKTCYSIYSIGEPQFKKNESSLRNTGRLMKNMRWFLVFFYEDGKVRHEYQYIDNNELCHHNYVYPTFKTTVDITNPNLSEEEKRKLYEMSEVRKISADWDKDLLGTLYIRFSQDDEYMSIFS